MCTSANRPFTMQTGDTIAELRISPYIGGSYLAENKLATSLSACTLLQKNYKTKLHSWSNQACENFAFKDQKN